jgi:outer membrane protein OmpA-like peptidoglycan-associated protein
MNALYKIGIALLLITICSNGLKAQFVQEKRIEAKETYIVGQVMHVTVSNAVSGEQLIADLNVNGLNPRKPVTFEAITDTVFDIRYYRLYSISCVQPGYMLYSEKFWPDEKKIHEQSVQLVPLRIGLKTDIQDITFLGDKTKIHSKSKPALDELINFLITNPELKVNIIGHVNGPDRLYSKNFYKEASLMRSKAVVDYLVESGIDKGRLKAKGAGNEEMIYPNPVPDWQSEANRRIEIEIVEM